MNNAELYQKSNSLQRRDAIQCLEKYSRKMQWKKIGDRIIDIGCGDGGVTDILKNYIPPDFTKILGCDISEKMIQFANEHHRDNRTEFTVLNIEGKLPENLKENFDHVFSFYALHWVKDQETCFRNIYDLLDKNGDCLLLFVCNMPIYEVYRILARNKKWSYYLKDVDRFISPYHDSQDPEKELTKLMDRIGYENIEVKCERADFIYNNLNVWRKSIEAVNPFNLPKGMIQEFTEDFFKIITDYNFKGAQVMIENNNLKISMSYEVLVVYARKNSL